MAICVTVTEHVLYNLFQRGPFCFRVTPGCAVFSHPCAVFAGSRPPSCFSSTVVLRPALLGGGSERHRLLPSRGSFAGGRRDGLSRLVSLVFWPCHEQSHRITESQNSRGWKGPLWVIQSNPPAKAGSPTAGCTGPCPGGS